MPLENLLKISSLKDIKALRRQWHKLAFKVVPYLKPYERDEDNKLVLLNPEDKATSIAIRQGRDVYVGDFMEGEFIHDLLSLNLINAGIMKDREDGEDGFLLRSGGFVNRSESQYFFGFRQSEQAFGNEKEKKELHRSTA